MQSSTLAPSLCQGETVRALHRVSLACLPCRSRHMKCNAETPICSRCAADSLACTYARSRRGHRRSRRLGETTAISNSHLQQATNNPTLPSPTSSSGGNGTTRSAGRGFSSTPITLPSSFSSENLPGADSIDQDLIGHYYTYFHGAHPCVLPRWALQQHNSTNPEMFTPILLVMQYIGSLFEPAVASEPLKKMAVNALPISPGYTGPLTPHQIQALMLFSIAIYWCDEIEEGLRLLDKAIGAALELRMQLAPFATEQGHDNPVLQESWRRTWWQLYVTDAHIAGSTHTFPTRVSGIEVTTLLPCEDGCYESGEIPPPRTLEEYDMREFLPDNDPGFSSFAHLVGITRTLDLVLSGNIPVAQNLPAICAQSDISLWAWCSLLPQSKRSLLDSKREVDMQLFKANILINTYIVDLHRPFSDLAYSDVESVARCAPPAPMAKQRSSSSEDTHVHTTKALLAIRRIGDLLPLPPNIVTQTPFTICMVANTLVAHLSACRYLFRGRALQLERERVRSSMGALHALGEYWPLGKRTYREMGVIAREILGLADRDIPRLQPRLETPPSQQQQQQEQQEQEKEAPPRPASSSQLPEMQLDLDAGLFDFQNLSPGMLTSCEAFLALNDVCQ